jgi:RNA polymerase sigma-70 factor, ECF subfamily
VRQSDLALIHRAVSGDQSACRELYWQHQERVRGYFARSGFCPADVDDLSQDTFVRFFRSLAGFDSGRGEIGTWLGATARNVARKSWARRDSQMQLDPELAESMFAALDSPADEALFREQVAAVRDCVGRLPDDLSLLVRLRYVEGLSTRGVSGRGALAESTTRVRLAEALRLLEQCLKSKGIVKASDEAGA